MIFLPSNCFSEKISLKTKQKLQIGDMDVCWNRMTGLLPCHEYRCKTGHKHHQQMIQKITPVDTESKLHNKIYNRLHLKHAPIQLLFTEQIDQINLQLIFRAFVKLHK